MPRWLSRKGRRCWSGRSRSRCTTKDTVSETCGGAVTACCSVSHAALRAALLACVWGGSTRFGSCPVGGLTCPWSCPGFQFLFVAAMLGAIAFAASLGFFFLYLVPFPGSWTVEEVVSFQEGKAKQGSGEHSMCWMISYLFVVGQPHISRRARFVPLAGHGGRHSSCTSVCACRCLHISWYAHWYPHTGRRLLFHGSSPRICRAPHTCDDGGSHASVCRGAAASVWYYDAFVTQEVSQGLDV